MSASSNAAVVAKGSHHSAENFDSEPAPIEAPNPRATSSFSDNHLRRIRVTFQCIDERLIETEAVLANAGSSSLFRNHTDDSTPIQRKVVHDYVVRLRESMRRILGELGIPPTPPACGALWAASTAVLFAGIDVEELDPPHMLGYGDLSEEATETLREICAELKGMLDKLKGILTNDDNGDFQARLAKLEQTSDEVRLLSELERIVTDHGLVEFRGMLTILLDRMEDNLFEIGVFGRVSSGKSSLLDHVLETNALPVGVTPVTAIPTRVSFGTESRARIEFADEESLMIPLRDLPKYATEQHNPSNSKHVARIEVNLPARRLREGVVFVDTPGLGSLAISGTELTVAYLPRCDLGVVLVDANAGLTTEDLHVVQALYRTGANATVLLSKADLLDEKDREEMVAYVCERLRDQVHVELSVQPISVIGANAALCDRWWKEVLEPQMEKIRALALSARKRKIGALRESIIAALAMRLQIEMPSSNRSADRSLSEASRELDSLRRESWDLAHTIDACADNIVTTLARTLAHVWTNSREVDPSQVLSEGMTEILAQPISAFPYRYEELRKHLVLALEQNADIHTESFAFDLPTATALPTLDTTLLMAQFAVQRPKLLTHFGEALLARHLRTEIETKFGPELRTFLVRYSRCLRNWLDQALKELTAAFEAAADLHRAKFNSSVGIGDTDKKAMKADLRLLRKWPGAPLNSDKKNHQP